MPATRNLAPATFCLFFIGAVTWLLAHSAAAQNPSKKPPEEVEEKVPPKPKGTLRVEDEGPEAKQQRRDKTASTRLAELNAEAARVQSPVLRDLCRQFSVPYDVVHFTQGTGKTPKIEPFARRVTENSRKSETMRFKPIDEKGARAATFEVKANELKSIVPFEELALNEVRRLVDPKGYAVGLPPRDVLRVAERILTAVISYHESARELGERKGDEWNDVVQRLRSQMLEVHVKTLDLMAADNNWDDAVALASRLADAYSTPDNQARFAKAMIPFISHPLGAAKYEEVSRRMLVLESLFPKSPLPDELRKRLADKAEELVNKAQQKMADNKPEATKLLQDAKLVWPISKSLRNVEREFNRGDFKPLNVGVRSPPEFLTPDTARTDTERQAVELLFEGLLKPLSEPEKGTRYFPCLAAERPRQIPLGREFHLDRDAVWSNGAPVTAADVDASFRKWKELGETDLIDDARPGDNPYQVSLSLRQGCLDPLALMTFKILPWGRMPTDRPKAREFARNPIGSGPYCFQKRDKDSVDFIANHNYHRNNRPEMPHIQLIRFYHAVNPTGDFQKTSKSGRLDVLLDLPTRDVRSIRSIGGPVSVHTLKNRRVYFLAVNHADRSQLLGDPQFRRGLAAAINRDEILSNVFRTGLGDDEKKTTHRPLNGPYPPQSWACNPHFNDKPDPFNPLLAKSLVEKSNGFVRGSKLTLKYPNDDPDVKKACEAIREQVQHNTGVELVLADCSRDRLHDDVMIDHNYQLAYWHLDYPDETYRLWPWLNPENRKSGGKNFFGYLPEGQLLRFMTSASIHRDFEQVKHFTHEIHAWFLTREMPFIPLWQLDSHIAIHADVKTFPGPDRLDPLRVFQDIEQWKFERSR